MKNIGVSGFAGAIFILVGFLLYCFYSVNIKHQLKSELASVLCVERV